MPAFFSGAKRRPLAKNFPGGRGTYVAWRYLSDEATVKRSSIRKESRSAPRSRPAARAIWKGRLSFGLVGIPVELVPAVDAREHVGFHLLHRKDLSPIRYRKFCSKENVEIREDEVVRGYEVSKGKWAVVEKDELTAARKDAGAGAEAHALEILSFLGAGRIDPLTFDQPYYIVPDEGGARSFAVFRNALAASDRVGLGRLRLRTREHLAAVVAVPHGLAAILLRPFEEIASPPAAGSLSAGSGEMKMARLLIDQMSEETLDPAKYPDRYRSELKKLLATKRAAATAPAPAEGRPEEGRVIDLMEALRASMAGRGRRSPRKRRVA